MKIYLTGASGFIGQNLIPFLEKSEHLFDINPVSVRYGIPIYSQANVYIHLAGKAHDIRGSAESTEYYDSNYLLTRKVYDAFLEDDMAECFIFLSSIKAISDNPGNRAVDETYEEQVTSIYGKSKKLAEDYILSRSHSKKVYILRPCMIHGPNNKGNLNLLYRFVKMGIPYPLASFENSRSFLSVGNLCFVIRELCLRKDIVSGIYHIADDQTLSTNQVVQLMGEVLKKDVRLWKLPEPLIRFLARIGDCLGLPLNSERLEKLTENYIVSNTKLKKVLKKDLPLTAEEGLRVTLRAFTAR